MAELVACSGEVAAGSHHTYLGHTGDGTGNELVAEGQGLLGVVVRHGDELAKSRRADETTDGKRRVGRGEEKKKKEGRSDGE